MCGCLCSSSTYPPICLSTIYAVALRVGVRIARGLGFVLFFSDNEWVISYSKVFKKVVPIWWGNNSSQNLNF